MTQPSPQSAPQASPQPGPQQQPAPEAAPSSTAKPVEAGKISLKIAAATAPKRDHEFASVRAARNTADNLLRDNSEGIGVLAFIAFMGIVGTGIGMGSFLIPLIGIPTLIGGVMGLGKLRFNKRLKVIPKIEQYLAQHKPELLPLAGYDGNARLQRALNVKRREMGLPEMPEEKLWWDRYDHKRAATQADKEAVRLEAARKAASARFNSVVVEELRAKKVLDALEEKDLGTMRLLFTGASGGKAQFEQRACKVDEETGDMVISDTLAHFSLNREQITKALEQTETRIKAIEVVRDKHVDHLEEEGRFAHAEAIRTAYDAFPIAEYSITALHYRNALAALAPK